VECRQETKQLSPQPEEPSAEIARRIRDFAIELHGVVHAPGDDVHLAQCSRRRYRKFQEDIQATITIPDFQSMGLAVVRQYIDRL
jgi:hypothetical protein